MPLGLGIWEIVILAGILLLLFGSKGAPKMARRLGASVKEVKDAVEEMHPRSLLDPKSEPAKPAPKQIEAATTPPPPQPAPAPDAEPPAS